MLPLNRFLLIGISLTALALIYVLQHTNYYSFFSAAPLSANAVFIFNKTFRLIANDLLCVLLIFALFQDRKYLKVAFLVLFFELAVIMPIYFWIKLQLEGDSEISSPLLSQVHRLIVNPMLMFVLIIGFYYQKYWATKK